MSFLARLKLFSTLTALVAEKLAIAPSAPMAAFKAAMTSSKIVATLRLLGFDLKAPAPVTPPEPVDNTPRNPSAKFYDFDPDRKPAQRKRENVAAMALLAQIDAGEVDGKNLTDAQKTTLAKYSGTGGALVGADGKKGSAYEYYTPKPIAEGMWSLMRELGFAGGKVLDPSAGVGIFGGTAPADTVVDAVELNETSGRINALVNQGPGYSVEVSAYEKVAAATPDELYDAVITNVPFGSVADRGGNELGDTRYQKEPLQNYFILRSLEKLKPGGLAAFITPPRCVSGKGGKEEQLRSDASFMAEFLGAYRLPNSVFGSASADTITDVIVFRKYSREVILKIEELREQNPGRLIEANVLWPEFVGGRYFTGEGKRFVLGEFIPKNPNDFRPIDRVVSDQSVPNIAKLLIKFPDSRVNWALLSEAETQPIIYAEGDTITQKGQTLQFKDGAWVVVASNEASPEMLDMGGRMGTPLQAFRNAVTWVQAVAYLKFMTDTSQTLDMPDWVRGAFEQLSRLSDEGERARYWNAGLVGMSVAHLLSEHRGEDGGYNFLEEFPELSEAMKRVASDARSCPSAVGGAIKSGMKALGVHYSKKSGYSGVWSGNVQGERADERTADQKFEGIKYKGQGLWVDRAEAAAIYGENFDPVADTDWCLSDDGKQIAKADDYFIGNYGDMMARLDKAALAATDPEVKGKLLAQRIEAEKRVERVDVSSVSFNLFSPYATMEEKAEFMRRFVSPHFGVAYDEETGKAYVESTLKKAETAREKLHKRMAQYLKNGTVTLGGAEVGDEKNAMAELRGMISTANEQFNGWCKANPVIIGRLHESANDPARLYFKQVEDESEIEIPGLSGNVTPHGYQNAFIRQQGRTFGGINGFGVGLGKAQPLYSKIMTPDGWKLMGDMRVGDMVIAVDGTATVVTGVYPQGEKEIFEVEFSDGAKTRCCDEHLWFTETENDRKKSLYHASCGRDVKFGGVKPLSDIRSSLIHGKKQKNHKIPMVAPVQFEAQEVPIDAYVLGALIGDGHFGKACVEFTCADDEMSNAISKAIAESGMTVSMKLKKQDVGKCKSFGITRDTMREPNNQMVRAISSLGLKSKLSHEKFIPQQYLFNTPEVRLAMLQGLMDTDGYVCNVGVTVQFSSSSEQLAKDVQFIVQSLGGSATIKSKIPTFKGVNGEKKNGLRHYTVHLRLPPSVMPFRLSRKIERVKPKSKYIPVRYITSVKEVGIAQAQCISIEHPTHLYVTDDFLVTHNTLTALASVAYVQSIGVKKKTAFIVPNSVLSNWRKEATNVYGSMDDCLFVGLDTNAKTGKSKVDSANYDRDLNIVRENRHSKIFMTMEAFQRLRLRDETIAGYEAFMRSVDASFAESEDKKADEVSKGKAKRLVALLTEGKSGATPYLEDLGIDSIVSDESHAYKNSAATVEFKSAKFLALAPSAARGIDMQAKAWFIRGKSPLKDGVLLLTATPITNSPLEIYSMLSLAVGRDRVNDMAMGIKGADQFMEVMCRVESEEDETVDGIVRDTRIFKGLENVSVLRKALGDVATIKDSASVGQQVKVPDADEVSSPVALPDPPILETLLQYKAAFRFAIDTISERQENRGDQAAYEAVAAKFGEPMELIGHPFNLINKMTMLIIDPELDQRATFYQVSSAQKDKAEAVLKTFNARKFIEERARPGPHTGADAVVGQITRKDGEDKTVFLKIQVAARLDGNRIIIDTISPETQSAFEAIAEKEGLELDVSVPPKLAALIANITKEETNPRGIDSEGNATPRVKQLIFCDILPLHNKIKRLLTKRAGIPAGAIAIITGKQNNTPDEIMAVQDGFNADGADNKYRIVIANEKAEVGINLQRGTQAVHHLTIGFTPDSLTQRNGRGVRQGNKTERVTIYTYDADGTFDSHKRAMVNKKSGWIDQVMDVNGGDSVNVEGGMSREQLEALIDTVGDSDAMNRLQERLASKEREVRAVGVRAKQTVNIRTVQASRKFLAENPDAKAWAARKFGQYFTVKQQMRDVEIRLGNPKASATALVKGQNLLADLTARAGGLRAGLTEALTITKNAGEPATIDELLASVVSGYHRKGTDMAQSVVEAITHGTYAFKVEAKENSAIANEWQSEVDMTKAMIKQAKTAFTKQGKEDGGIPKEVMDAFAEGNGVIFDGKPVVDGTFIKTESGSLGVVKDGGLVIQAWDATGRSGATRLGSLRPPYAITLPGSADYDALVTEAAKIDDAIATAGVALSESSAVVTFSALVPAVSQRRTTTTLMMCSISSVGLPAPYFSRVFDPALSATGPVFAAIIAAQSAVVKAYSSTYSGTFTVEMTVPVIEITRDMRAAGALPDMAAFARAHGLKITMAEVLAVNMTSVIARNLMGRKDIAHFESVLTGETEEALKAAAGDWARAVMADLEMGETDPLDFLQWSEKHALQGAIKKAMTPPQVPVAEATEPTVDNPAPSGSIGDNDMVGVTGNTMTWKNWIKTAATDVGSRAIWDGKAECWNIPYKAWINLTQKNPRCLEVGQLTMVEFSGKAAYGKRK